MSEPIDFRTSPDVYRHWRLDVDGPIATLTMEVDPAGGLRTLDSDSYELKLNSYDLGVDIELYDAVQRLRFEHPEVRAVVVTSGLEKVFCSGANIQMLAGSSHAHKVNFCKFTNETRNSIEDATAHSGQVWIAAVNGTAAGGGYELALACDEIVLVDDRSSTVSLPEVPLLAVLPGTGGLTRVVDKRHVRRDLADVFATRAEGVKGRQAVEWKLVDSIAPRSTFDRPRRRTGHRARRRIGSSERWRRRRALVIGTVDRRRHDLVSQRRRVDRPRARCRPHHGPRRRRRRNRPRRPSWSRPAATRGSSPSPASSTMRCCTCGSTRPMSELGCSTPAARSTR